MELSEEIFHQIHQYLSGQGSQEQRADFEKRMQAEQDLADEVATQRRIRNGLRTNDYKKLFQDIHTELQNEGALSVNDVPVEKKETKTIPLTSENTSRQSNLWPYLVAAASVLIAIGIVWFVNIGPKNNRVASDISAPEIPPKDTTVTVQPAGTPDTTKAESPKVKDTSPKRPHVNGTEFFATYFDAKIALESPFSKDKLGISPSALAQWRTDTTHVHEGVRYLAERKAEKSLQEFQQIENSRFQQVKNVASWYIALAYLQQNDLKNCKKQLEKVIADPKSAYANRAAELLAKIQ